MNNTVASNNLRYILAIKYVVLKSLFRHFCSSFRHVDLRNCGYALRIVVGVVITILILMAVTWDEGGRIE